MGWRAIPLKCAFTMFLVLSSAGVGAEESAFKPLSSTPEDVVVMGEWVYFSADDGRFGRELWRSDIDGNAERLTDLSRGTLSSDLYSFYPFKGVLYFGYRPDGEDGQLWRSDGTEAGTYRVSRFPVEDKIEPFRGILDHSDTRLYVVTGGGQGTQQLWETDGTERGTRRVREASEGNPVHCDTFHGVVSGGDLYLNMKWKKQFAVARVDGSTGLAHIIREFESESVSFFALDSGEVLFSGFEADTGGELWKTGPMPGSCELVMDIYPGKESSKVGEMHRFTSNPYGVMTLFVATTPDYGRELWKTDGTREGTTLWKDLIEGAGSSDPNRLTSERGELYFVALGKEIGREVWYYSAATDEFNPISDVNPGLGSSGPYAFCLANNSSLYFSAEDQYVDEELWVYPGAGKESRRVADIYPGHRSSYPSYTARLGSAVITVATDPVVGRELRICSPNDVPRVLVDIWTDNSVNPASSPNQFTVFRDRLFFVANDLRHGNELWSSDGTSTGTELVKDIHPDRKSSNPSQLTVVGDLLYFVADDGIHGYELWRSDGTEEGTAMTMEIAWPMSPRIRHLTAFKENLLFSAWRENEGAELWIVRPGRNPEILKDINAGPDSSEPNDLVVWNDHVYFQADDGLSGTELWRTDGTENGTILVKDIINAPVEKISALEVHPALGRLIISAEVDGAGAELWALQEQGSALQLVRDIASPSVLGVLNPLYVPAP